MIDLNLPRTVAGYAAPICPHCDKEYGTEVADVGPVQCDACGKWFEVRSQVIYKAAEILDYTGEAAAPSAKKPARAARKSSTSKPKTAPKKAATHRRSK